MLTCVNPAPVQLRRTVAAGSCDGASVPPDLLYTASAGVAATVSPEGPYPPGTTTVRVTPAPGSPVGAVECVSSVVVTPCAAECQAGLAAAADPGKCSRAALPDGFLLAASVGRTASSVATTPALPLPVGTTRVSAAVSYGRGAGGGGAVSARSADCAVTVRDAEKPAVAALSPCLYPAGTGAYTPAEVCFKPADLLSAAGDNCGAQALRLLAASCANVSPSANGATACRANATAGVCVALRRLPQTRTTARVVRATIRATDAAGNAAEAAATVRVFRRAPTNAALVDRSCLRVSSRGQLQAPASRRAASPLAAATAAAGERMPRVRMIAAEGSDDA